MNAFYKSITLFYILLWMALPLGGCSDDSSNPGVGLVPQISAVSYPIVDTGQTLSYSNTLSISAPAVDDEFYGQDAHFTINPPRYNDNGDGTVTDLVTDLMWQQDPGTKITQAEAQNIVDDFDLAGHSDWRIPTIKELYSLIRFDGTDPSGMQGDDTSGLTPFIDSVFSFEYGDPTQGERIIDSQFLTSTLYVSTTMNGDETVFGVNFADGRIKGYPVLNPQTQAGNTYFSIFVRGGESYGINSFEDNGDGTITDSATGLMWMQQDSGHLNAGQDGGLNWEDALAWSTELEHATHSDWRLPTAKELQSIVDYTRSPATHGTAAIDPIFLSSAITDEGGGTDFAFYWSSTTHANYAGSGGGAYVAFGTGYGFMEMPPESGAFSLLDVHGAGCQRSDPKFGNPADYPTGHGPQGDAIRIYNHVRCVRNN